VGSNVRPWLLGDVDGALIVRARIFAEDMFPDGAAESVECALKGSSVSGFWDQASQSFEMSGSDTLESYRDILASARYLNTGRAEHMMPATSSTRTSAPRFLT